jgi:hypothetical protein
VWWAGKAGDRTRRVTNARAYALRDRRLRWPRRAQRRSNAISCLAAIFKRGKGSHMDKKEAQLNDAARYDYKARRWVRYCTCTENPWRGEFSLLGEFSVYALILDRVEVVSRGPHQTYARCVSLEVVVLVLAVSMACGKRKLRGAAVLLPVLGRGLA